MSDLDYPQGFDKAATVGPGQDQFVFPDGEYEFSVSEAEATTYSTGKKGINITLEGAYRSGKTFVCYERVFFTEPAKPRYEAFLASIGLDPAKKPSDTKEIIGKAGKAAFVGDPDKEHQWPKVRFYINGKGSEERNWDDVGEAPMGGTPF
jgi:hypothetical protein